MNRQITGTTQLALSARNFGLAITGSISEDDLKVLLDSAYELSSQQFRNVIVSTQSTSQARSDALDFLAANLDQGYAEAGVILGDFFSGREKISNLERDYAKAFGFYKQAEALDENTLASYAISDMLWWGLGTEMDREEAVSIKMKLARKGVWWAQNDIGLLYCKGIHFSQNFRLAEKWFIAASWVDKGDNGKGFCPSEEALHNLLKLYATGKITSSSITGKMILGLDLDWQYLAIPEILYNIGIMHEKGIIFPQSYAESYKWKSLAKQNGFNADKYNSEVYYLGTFGRGFPSRFS